MIERVVSGDFRSIARLITLVEDGSPDALPLMRALFPHTGRCLSIGVTGSPGAGKSTLVDKLAAQFRLRSLKVGIIAVDPTSPFSGGAILGDRIRMQSRALDAGIFIRSMATRGNLGGLAHASADAAMILDAAGFDIVLIETVGVGQDEVDVARTAHLTMVLLVPGMGDDVQTMKAGIMEIGDIFVINKADHPGVERVEAEVNALLGISNRKDGWRPVIIRTIASEGIGVEACVQAIESWRLTEKESHHQLQKRIQIQKERLLEIVQSQVRRSLLRTSGIAQRIEQLARGIAERSVDPYTAAEELMASWKSRAPGSAE